MILHKYNDGAIQHVDQAIYDFTRKEAANYFGEMKPVFDMEIQKYVQEAAKEYIDKEITRRLKKIVE